MVDLSKAKWRKSSRSGGNNSDNCVMVADLPGLVAVHDSKVGPEAGTHVYDGRSFAGFVADIKAGRYDR